MGRGHAAGIDHRFGPGETVKLERGTHRFDPARAVYRYSPAGKPTIGHCTGLNEGPEKNPYRTPSGWEHVGTLTFGSERVRCEGPPGTRFATGDATTDLDADFARFQAMGAFILWAFLIMAIGFPVLSSTDRSTLRRLR
jgi:hypothetical protein